MKNPNTTSFAWYKVVSYTVEKIRSKKPWLRRTLRNLVFVHLCFVHRFFVPHWSTLYEACYVQRNFSTLYEACFVQRWISILMNVLRNWFYRPLLCTMLKNEHCTRYNYLVHCWALNVVRNNIIQLRRCTMYHCIISYLFYIDCLSKHLRLIMQVNFFFPHSSLAGKCFTCFSSIGIFRYDTMKF